MAFKKGSVVVNTGEKTVRAIINKRFDAVVFMNIGDKAVQIRDARPTKYTIYAAGIRRGTSEDVMVILLCPISTLQATTINKLHWHQMHLRTYSDITDLYKQFTLRWDLVQMDQDLNINGYDDAPSVPLTEISSMATNNRATYTTKDKQVHLILQTANPDPDGLGGHDLPQFTDLIPAIEQFNTVIVLN
jgi:hypothetical protein